MRSIIDRYIFKELLAPFGIALAFFSFIFIMTQLPAITNYVISYQIGLKTVVLLLIYAMPFFLQFIVPMSVMISVLLTFLSMSGDMEIVALKAGGISIYRLLPPVLTFGLVGAVLTAGLSIFGLPAGRKATARLLRDVAASHVDLGLKPRQFIDSFKDVVLYVHAIDPHTKQLKDVFIEDRRSPDAAITVVAPQGQLSYDTGKMVVNLRLLNGTIHQVDLAERRAMNLRFGTYDLRLDVKSALAAGSKRSLNAEEMSMHQLRETIDKADVKDERYYKALLEWHKKFSLPMACLALALLAVPLGITTKSTKRSYGIGLGMVFFLLYYIMLSAGWVFGESGLYPPLIGMWVPNVVSAAVGAILLVRCVHEQEINWPSLPKWLRRFKLSGQR